MLTFPTAHTMIKNGYMPRPGVPDRARPCVCVHGPMVDASDPSCVTCIRCGRYPAETISDTWRRRAEQIARQARQRAA